MEPYKVIKPSIDQKTDGNIFSVISATKTALYRAGKKDASKQFEVEAKELMARKVSYHEMLAHCFQYVDWGRATQWVDKDEPHLPAGDYVISDPCYVLSSDDYGDLLDQQPEEGGWHGVYEIRGHKLGVLYTLNGDGRFQGDYGEYTVDSGHIACVPIALLDSEMNVKPKVFRIDFAFNVEINDGDGRHDLVFGPIETIVTGPEICDECSGHREYCECENCGGCTQYGCSCDDEDEDDE